MAISEASEITEKNVEFVLNDQLQHTTKTLVYTYFFLVFILVLGDRKLLFVAGGDVLFEVLLLGSNGFLGEQKEISCR